MVQKYVQVVLRYLFLLLTENDYEKRGHDSIMTDSDLNQSLKLTADSYLKIAYLIYAIQGPYFRTPKIGKKRQGGDV